MSVLEFELSGSVQDLVAHRAGHTISGHDDLDGRIVPITVTDLWHKNKRIRKFFDFPDNQNQKKIPRPII